MATSGRPSGMLGRQMLGIALSRYILRLPPVVALDRETLTELVMPILNHFLTEPIHSGKVGTR